MIITYDLCALVQDASDEKPSHPLSMSYMRSCPSPTHAFSASIRKPMKDLVSGVCLLRHPSKRLSAMDFRVSQIGQMPVRKMLYNCCIPIAETIQLSSVSNNRQRMPTTVSPSQTWASQWSPWAMAKCSSCIASTM